MQAVDLSSFRNDWYHPGRSRWWQVLWFLFGLPLLRCPVLPSSSFRRVLLRFFGAKVGQGVVIKPGVRVKYPWRLSVGDHTWLGEDCWIDNLAQVDIGRNVCISQGAYLCTGNHDWSDPSFGLRVSPIRVEDGAWVGAKAVLVPGIILAEACIVTAGSVATQSVPAFAIHAGNPARFVRLRPLRGQQTFSSTMQSAGD